MSRGGLGVIWTCDHCKRQVETGLDDLPAGWLVLEFDDDDFPNDMDVPTDVDLCPRCAVTDLPTEVDR